MAMFSAWIARRKAFLHGSVRVAGAFLVAFAALAAPCLADDSGVAGSAVSQKRLALLIANSAYPDADRSNGTTAKDAALLQETLRRDNFVVDIVTDARKQDLQKAIDALAGRVTPGATVLFYFGGFGIQAGRTNYLIPVDARIWSEADVRIEGLSLDAILGSLSRAGARAKIAIVDASRPNPYERRFRMGSLGLTAIDVPDETLVLSAAAPNKIVEDGQDDGVSPFMRQLASSLSPSAMSVEDAFIKTRTAVARASKDEETPWVASSLTKSVSIDGRAPQVQTAEAVSAPARPALAQAPPPPPKAQARPESPAPRARPWPVSPLTAAPSSGLTDVAIPFGTIVTSLQHPSSRLLVIDDRGFSALAADTRTRLIEALKARADQRGADMLSILAPADQNDPTVQLLTGLGTIIKGDTGEAKSLEGDWGQNAELHFRRAMAGGQPQAATFLGLLLTTRVRRLSGTPEEGRNLLLAAAASGERGAQLAAGIGYLNGEFGGIDADKGADLIRSAAESGEPFALMHYARLLQDGRGVQRDAGIAETALRRAAATGLTDAEFTLGHWILAAYFAGKIDDPSEGVALSDKARLKGAIGGLANLGWLYAIVGKTPPWNDRAKGYLYLSQCAQFRVAQCHNNLGVALQSGRGTPKDPVAAWAHYEAGRQLNNSFVMPQMAKLEQSLSPDQKTEAQNLATLVMSILKPLPPYIYFRRD